MQWSLNLEILTDWNTKLLVNWKKRCVSDTCSAGFSAELVLIAKGIRTNRLTLFATPHRAHQEPQRSMTHLAGDWDSASSHLCELMIKLNNLAVQATVQKRKFWHVLEHKESVVMCSMSSAQNTVLQLHQRTERKVSTSGQQQNLCWHLSFHRIEERNIFPCGFCSGNSNLGIADSFCHSFFLSFFEPFGK